MAKKNFVHEVSEKEFDSFTKKGIILIDFFAEWCMPCVMMSPVIDELSEKFEGKIKFGKVNIEESQKLAQKFEVSSIPNLVLLKDGKMINRFVGSMSSEELEERLEEAL